MGYSLNKSMRKERAAILNRAKGKCEMCKVKQGTERVSTIHRDYRYNVKLSVVHVNNEKDVKFMALCEICRVNTDRVQQVKSQ